ncbi:unnamed protein product [Darwinula stevensoni]|uniref:Uncharacterized protein n=1 Tax=Darwinula stevensoni TaxID=69355 RepID=A0A7R9AJ63_9CRUS|nr:unnamed protein product [Darwinula stevensoni]CAG0907218.1 unnamed protein product [Darwinula stevensoni]
MSHPFQLHRVSQGRILRSKKMYNAFKCICLAYFANTLQSMLYLCMCVLIPKLS